MKKYSLVLVALCIHTFVFAGGYYDYIDDARNGDAAAQYNLGWCYHHGEGVVQDYYQAAYWYKKSAEQGFAGAQINLGWCYDTGKGVPQDDNQAVYWYKKSAEQGNAYAQNNLGVYYEQGKGVAQDYNQAEYWYKKSAEQGNAFAQSNLGNLYFDGKGVAQDNIQAVYWYRKSAEHGNAQAQKNLGWCYEKGKGVAQDYNQAVYWYRKSAEQGDAQAQKNLGGCYYDGNGVTQDYNQAVYWYRKSAEQNNADAQCDLGLCYENGNGVPQDYNQAVYWTRKSAEQGNATGQRRLGWCYVEGKGVLQDYKQAAYWFKKSAEQGDEKSQGALGWLYDMGNGVPQDYNQAIYWYLRAAEQGHVGAQYNIGLCYAKGRGVPQDYEKAAYWYRKAAEQGDSESQSELGWCYYEGEGVAQDYNQAIYWFKKAVEQNDVDAFNGLAYCYAAQNDFTNAHVTIDKLINKEPTEANWYDSKGEFYIMQKNYAKAKEMWNKIIKIDPDYGKNRTNLYLALFESENIDFDIPKNANTSKDCFALIIANEHYKQEGSVPFAGNDGEIVYKYFTQTLGILEKHIKFIKDASLNDMRYTLNWLKNIAEAYNGEAKVIVYYAGHGIPDEASGTSYLLPSDGYGSDVTTGYKVSDLYATLGAMPLKSAVVLMDACFSGAKRDGKMMASARGVAIKTKNNTPSGNVVVLSAAQGDETAYAKDKAQHGMFTYYLLKKLQESKGDVSIDELSSYIISNVRKESIVENGKSQTPCVLASPTVADVWRTWRLK